MALMHHFSVEADRVGIWDLSTIQYLGHIEAAEHHAKNDTPTRHYDQSDGNNLQQEFWDVAGFERVDETVAITMIWKDA